MKTILSALLALGLMTAPGIANSITPTVDAIERVLPAQAPGKPTPTVVSYRIWMGYHSRFSFPVSLGSELHGADNHSGVPPVFHPGRHYAVLWVTGSEVVWNVGGRTATASLNFQSVHPRDFLDTERPFAPGGVVGFDFRTIQENGAPRHIFRWWRRNPSSGKIPGALPFSGDKAITYTFVLTESDRLSSLARLGLPASQENNRRALINEALRRVDTLTTEP